MTTPETRCAPKHPTPRSDRMPETKGGPDSAQTLPGPNAHGSATRSDVNAMSKDTESPAGGVNEGLRGRAIEAAAAQSWWDDYGAGWDNGDTTEDDKAERREQVGPMVDAVLTVLPSGDGLRDALRALVDDEPLIVHGIRRDLERLPSGRGGTLRHDPATPGIGAAGCPGDNLIGWLDRIRSLLATDRPVGDA